LCLFEPDIMEIMSIEYKGLSPLFQVFDMPTSLAFYRDILGFELVFWAPADREQDQYEWVMLRSNGTEIMLNTRFEADSRPPQPDPAVVKAHDDTCIYFGVEDVNGVYEYLLSKGIKLNPPRVAHYGVRQLYVHDPDGFNLCFQWPER
jgi:glyoxylase I family protein